MKIFMGMRPTGSLMYDYATGFRELGHEVFCAIESDLAIVRSDVDLHIPNMLAAQFARKPQASNAEKAAYAARLKELAWRKALESDLCFFIWSSFLPDASDLRTLHRMGKKIVVRFCGSEVRDPEVDRQMAALHGTPHTDYGLSRKQLPHKLHWLRMCEKYADLLIAGSTMSLRPFSGRFCLLFQHENIVCNTQQRQHPVLLHAPSRTATKGTAIWMEIFDALRSAGLQFGVKLVRNIPHEDMPKEYASADIFCNSLFYGGRASWEAMAAGCVVVSGDVVSSWMKYCRESTGDNLRGLGVPYSEEAGLWYWTNTGLDKHFYPVTPEISLPLDSVTEQLARLILDWPRRQRLAEQGPRYVAELLSPRVVCQDILDYLDDPHSLEQRSRLVWTPFFNQEYSPENDSPEEIALFNRYTDMVRSCPWYRDYVVPMERGGLRF